MKNTVLFKILKSLFLSQVSHNIRRGSNLCQAIGDLFSPLDPFSLNHLLCHHFLHSVLISSQMPDLMTKFLPEMSILQRTSNNLSRVNISCSMAAINTPASAASLNIRVTEPNGLLVTLLSFFWWLVYRSHSIHSATNKDDKTTLWGSIF